MSKNGFRPNEADARKLLLNSKGSDYQCALMRHNHTAVMQKLSEDELYINTGTWQDIFQHNPKDPCSPIPVSNRDITLLFLEEPTKQEKRKTVHAYLFTIGDKRPLLIAQNSYLVKR